MAEVRYLYPHRKRLEILSAVFAAGFGVNFWLTAQDGAPLAWAGLDNAAALLFGQAVSWAAFVHGLGVNVNGQWRWSPALRLVGMSCHALLFAWLASRGAGGTAVYTYGWISLLMAYGAYSAGVDTYRAAKGRPEWMPN